MKHVTSFWKSMAGAGVLLGVVTLASGGPAEGQNTKAKPYPLKTCVVSGEKLGEMGKPHVFIYQGREIKLCCKSCLKDFNKEPGKYLKKLEESEKGGKDGQKPAAPAHNHGGHQY